MNEYLKLAISQIPRYFMDLLELAVGPKKFLADRCVPGEESVNRAFVFFGITLLIVAIMQIPSLPKKDNLLLEFAIYTASVGIIQLATILVMRLAWKIVGGKAELRELFMCTAYVSAPVLFIALTFALVGEVMFQVIDPEGSAILRSNPMAQLPETSVEKGGYAISQALISVGFGLACIWFVVAWGAYRVLNGVSRLRSTIAFFLYILLSLPLYGVAILFSMHQLLALKS